MRGERPSSIEEIAEDQQLDRARQAKIDRLVADKLFKREEFDGLSTEEVDELLQKEFDPYYTRDPDNADAYIEKQRGHVAEDVFVEFVNELNLNGIRAEKGTPEQDHGPEQIDIRLYVPGGESPINLQVTLRRDEGVAQKFGKLIEKTIPVILPGNILEVAKKHNIANMRSVVHEVLRQVLEGMAKRPFYRGELHALQRVFLKPQRT